MTTIKGFLIERDGRSLFMREIQDWALEDSEYTVTPLVPLKATDVDGQLLIEAPAQPSTDDTQERLQLLEQIYELEEQQIAEMKHKLEEAVELVESIHEFASKQTNNIMESRGLLLLIAEACSKWLEPRQD